MSGRHWVGVDLGTSSAKVLACREDGAIVAEAEAALTVTTPRPDRSEADPTEWERVVEGLLTTVLGRAEGSLAGVGVTGQMHGTILVDSDGALVGPAILWPDRRGTSMAARWAALPGRVRARLGGPFSPGMTGPVTAWLAEHEPSRLDRAASVMLPKDWLRHRLDASHERTIVTDSSDAAGTLLWDVAAGAWSPETVTAVLPRPGLLPPVVDSTRVTGSYLGAPLVAGGGDTPVSLVALHRAIGGWQPGDLVVNLGTGAQVIDPAAESPAGEAEPGWHVYDDATGGWYAMVAILNGGLALSWVRDRLGLDWARYAAAAETTPAGAGGVSFRPFLAEERGVMRPPVCDVGWDSPRGTPDQLARAAAEAQIFLIRRAYEVLGVPARRVLVVGGGARQAWVQQLIADVLGVPVHRVALRSAAAMGAACLAGPTIEVPARVRIAEPHADPALEAAYRRWHGLCYPGAG